jgi:hypothetical protein
LIEDTGQGPALLSEIRAQTGMTVHAIIPVDEKIERIGRHLPTIRAGRIQLPEDATWREEFISEMSLFPYAGFDDQVDATAQYLEWIAAHPGSRYTWAVLRLPGWGLSRIANSFILNRSLTRAGCSSASRIGTTRDMSRRRRSSSTYTTNPGSAVHRQALRAAMARLIARRIPVTLIYRVVDSSALFDGGDNMI